MANQSTVIFDFDGTLVDSFSLMLTLIGRLVHQDTLLDSDVSRLRGLDLIPFLRELHVPLWRVPILALRIRREFAHQLQQVELFSGIDAAVRTLAKQHTLFVLSSNSEANVRAVLQRYNIEQYFRQVHGNARQLHKEHGLRQLIRRNGIAAKDAWYVGDETGDIDAAHQVGLRAVAVSWGYKNISALSRHHPEALVFTPDELVGRLNSKGRSHGR